MTDQGDLFRAVDPAVHDDARPRLSRQCAAILARLEAGPATNTELARIAIRYSARIHDLRQPCNGGHDIRIVERDHESGVTLYELRG